MGSEHYCLRWNNHQSNLLGVFSQLLQDESLVDVTLACSEGASIRAHKVVLSACSSYFQSLFLDHPSRHPIVILKDVRFSELQTLVEFMYKGEVNVQYCQLSALLKTAESLKVKGLAEMTNQNSALREPEREPDRLRPHSQPKPSSCGETPIEVSGQSTPTPTPQSSSNSSSTVTAINATSLSLKREGEACSPSSPKRLQSSPTPLDLYQRKCPSRSNRDRDRDREPIDPSSMIEDRSPSPCDRPNSIEEDDPMSNDVIGINMSMNPMLSVAGNTSGSVGGSGNSVQSIQQSVVVPPVNSSSSSVDLMRPSSRGGSGGAGTSGSSVSGSGGGGGSNVTLTSTVTHTATSSGLSSPIISTEPVAGPSGLGPVQSVPLSLKKEVDWDRSDEKSTSDTIEYRHSHDSADDRPMPNYSGSPISIHPAARCQTPFVFPFSPLSLGLFDTDPSRILNMLHHQTLLAEEALRYRGLLFSPKDPLRYSSSISEILSKEQEFLCKRSSPLYKQAHRYPTGVTSFHQETPLSYQKDSLVEELKKKSEETVQREEEENDLRENGNSSKDSLSEFLRRRSSLSMVDGLRYNQLSSTETSSCKEKSSSSSTSSTPPPLIKPVSDSILFSEPIEEETRCVVCNANFPNVWLLEQHAALQHANLGPNEEKPFICEQCGQSYRYRSAYAKHKEQNHRARLPADKLFTCDVCGMQFRYLKSFKKHRLNHALERLHGKKERRSMDAQSQDVVTSSNETILDESGTDLRVNIKREKDDDDQDSTVDSAGAIFSDHNSGAGEPKISSSEGILHSTNKLSRPPSSMEPESSHSTTSINSLINAERIPSDQVLGLNPQEASILNFLRVDAAERQRDKRPPTSRFACPFCGKCVRSKENLKLHVRKHTGERPFVCLFCGRAFGGKSDLTRHLRIHTGERPYHCESCGKCFARADYLSKHLTTHIHNTPR
ncbi:broad-complex core protein isoforms 1/2/3/4/5 isoform X2 [Hermetia illucens]|uniref:broad-complex core protein isoforms 1/2/3/4/5 isoform X2 n=1 Tax=Hermetia illucens TaxID=343691 RepID=UPI0018CC0905|nr:broad-complex core protein isoforms 1/2/3/4/5 isoform X2 [Hermetia illucens]